MPGLRGVGPCLERVAVAHFAHQNDVRVFTHGMLQGDFPALHINADFSLVDDRLVVLKEVFDRVFDGQDVASASMVDVV